MRAAIPLVILALGAGSPAAAQSLSFGVEVGAPVYLSPPPVYYEPRILYGAPPAVYYEDPRVHVAPAPRARVLHMEAPEDVVERLAERGYTDIGPIDRRGALYVLTATNRKGDLVELEISIFSGKIERSSVLERRYATQPKRLPRKPVAQAAAAPPKVAPAPAQKPAPASAPAEQDEEQSGPEPDSNGGASSTLRDRLHTPPSKAPSETNSPDPLVVY
jgi:hypothetical protein